MVTDSFHYGNKHIKEIEYNMVTKNCHSNIQARKNGNTLIILKKSF